MLKRPINVDQSITKSFNSFFINNNNVSDSGGAAYVSTEEVNVVITLFESKSANVDGGAIYCVDNINVKHCICF